MGTQLADAGLLPAGVSMLTASEVSGRAADAGQSAGRPDKTLHWSIHTGPRHRHPSTSQQPHQEEEDAQETLNPSTVLRTELCAPPLY